VNSLKDIEPFLNYLGDAVIVVDKQSNVVFSNIASQEMFKYTKQAMESLKVEQLMASSSARVNHNAKMKAYIQQNKRAQTIKPKSGSILVREALSCVKSTGEKFRTRVSVSNILAGDTNYGLAIVHDYSGVYELISKLNTEVVTDTLTGLYNVRFLQHFCENELSPECVIGVAYCDLGKFKRVNDQYGHRCGDIVLKEFAARIRKILKPSDRAIRIGGDEFLIVYRLTSMGDHQEELGMRANTLAGVAHSPFYLVEKNAQVQLNLSVGLGIYPYDHPDLMQLIDMVDQAMYASKAQDIPYQFVIGVPDRLSE
jgi:diguanylate cyclase (GGDEF)-like protein/PAS domain S-box-containing protein